MCPTGVFFTQPFSLFFFFFFPVSEVVGNAFGMTQTASVCMHLLVMGMSVSV